MVGWRCTAYEVRTSTDGGSSWSSWAAMSGVTSPQTVSGLTNGTALWVQIRAVNGKGGGAASNTSAAFTPLTTPGAPTGVSGVHGNGQLALSWTAPVV